MADQLSGIAIIICIAFGVLTFILLFIFAKRQITRFALKSRRGPHVPIAIDVPKKLNREIHRRISITQKIHGEPLLLNEQKRIQFSQTALESVSPSHLFRMKVVEDVKDLDKLISHKHLSRRRCPDEDVQVYYLKLHKDGKLPHLNIEDLNKFLILYERARYEPQVFSHEEYKVFVAYLDQVRNSLCQNCSTLKASAAKKLSTHDDDIKPSEEEPLESTSFFKRKPEASGLFAHKHLHITTPMETPV